MVYILTVVIQSFSYAYSGNQISEHSVDIFKATWEGNWYHLDIDNQKIIAMMLLRSKKAKLVHVPFFEVTLTAFTKVK